VTPVRAFLQPSQGGYRFALMPSIAKTRSLDHLVLIVKDLSATIRFYEEIMGMKHDSFSPATDPDTKRHALSFGTQKINLHISGKELEPKAQVRHFP
jgi:catechol 2,3-dioxygenase-like lactoylglutathione lyase family enzyme